MPWYSRIQSAINTALPELVSTQKTNLALASPVSAILKKRALCPTELARAYRSFRGVARSSKLLARRCWF